MAETYTNHYYHCNVQWDDEWDCMCNDGCPFCHHEIEPYASTQDGHEIIHNQAVYDKAVSGEPCCPACGDAACDEHRGLQSCRARAMVRQ
jgi:hypothetical protein